MTSPNHIVGGICITGISLSFWDINIFANASYLSLCIFTSILPDIDHTKSIIGKLFYPVAKYLDKKFGHRTITHSLTALIPIFLFFLFFELNFINPYFDRTGIAFSLIFLFSYFSHLILDMLTIQGIPLFYPFLKNPCVVPANPSMRFRSGNLKSEAMVLFLFTIVLMSSYDLFKNGFWTTYNRSFGTITHVYREFSRSTNWVQTKYDFDFNGKHLKGKGIVISAKEYEIILFTNGKILKLNSKNPRLKNIDLIPKQLPAVFKTETIHFYNWDIQTLNKMLENKVVSGHIFSENSFVFNNQLQNELEFINKYSPNIIQLNDTTFNAEKQQKIAILEAEISQIQRKNNKKLNDLQKIQNALKTAKTSLKSASNLYFKNKFEQEILQQKKKLASFDLNLISSKIQLLEIENLKQNHHKKNITYQGTLEYYVLPKKILLAQK